MIYKFYRPPDFSTAARFLDFVTFSPQLLNYVVQAIFVYSTNTFGRNLKRDPPVFFCEKVTLCLQVGQESALGFYIRV
jgi:hypothetical protein